MEQELLPGVLEKFDKIAGTLQEAGEAAAQAPGDDADGREARRRDRSKPYEKLKAELIELMRGIRLNNDRIEMLVDELYGLNRR